MGIDDKVNFSKVDWNYFAKFMGEISKVYLYHITHLRT